MKINKLFLLLSTITLMLLISSCSVYEDIYFKEDGKISYQMKFDASEALAFIPFSLADNEKIPTDSIISFAKLIKEKEVSEHLSANDLKELESISMLYLKVAHDDKQKELSLAIFGNFDNSAQLNKALKAINNQQMKNKGNLSPEMPPLEIDKIATTSTFVWDGETMSRSTPEESSNAASNRNENLEEGIENDLSKLFSQGRMVVKYHFPSKVKNISDSNALISQDGKTVIIEYPATTFVESDNSTDIQIKLK